AASRRSDGHFALPAVSIRDAPRKGSNTRVLAIISASLRHAVLSSGDSGCVTLGYRTRDAQCRRCSLTKPFASSADLSAKSETLEILAPGVYALTAEGDPNVGAIEGEDFIVAFEARATPAAARKWLDKLREHTRKPVRHLVLSHYHAVRVLGASA